MHDYQEVRANSQSESDHVTFDSFVSGRATEYKILQYFGLPPAHFPDQLSGGGAMIGDHGLMSTTVHGDRRRHVSLPPNEALFESGDVHFKRPTPGTV